MPRQNEENRKLAPFDLKAALEGKGMTQEQAAEFFSASQASVARWCSDGSLPALHRKYWALHWQHNKPGKQKSAKPAAVK
jgi:hypothetical protein